MSEARSRAQRRSASFLRQSIAHRMAVGVVDLLKAIEIETYDGRQIAMARGRGQCLFHAVFEQQAVRQAGENVVIRLMEEPVVQLLAFGNVLRQREARLGLLRKG